jgi:hypothetical protein
VEDLVDERIGAVSRRDHNHQARHRAAQRDARKGDKDENPLLKINNETGISSHGEGSA